MTWPEPDRPLLTRRRAVGCRRASALAGRAARRRAAAGRGRRRRLRRARPAPRAEAALGLAVTLVEPEADLHRLPVQQRASSPGCGRWRRSSSAMTAWPRRHRRDRRTGARPRRSAGAARRASRTARAARLRPAGPGARASTSASTPCPATTRRRPRSCRMPGRPARRPRCCAASSRRWRMAASSSSSAPANPVPLPARPLRAGEPDRPLPQDAASRAPSCSSSTPRTASPSSGCSRRPGQELYPGMIEWVPLSSGGKVTEVDADDAGRCVTDFGGYTADVANVIPPQRAGRDRRSGRRRRPQRLVPDRPGDLRVARCSPAST